MADTIRKPETESGLSKQLLGNFHTENSFEAKVKNRVPYKKMCLAMTELINYISNSMELHALFISTTFIATAGLNWKKSKQSLSTTLRLNLYFLKIIRFLHPCYHPKWDYMIKKNNKKACIIQTVRIFYSSVIKHLHIF